MHHASEALGPIWQLRRERVSTADKRMKVGPRNRLKRRTPCQPTEPKPVDDRSQPGLDGNDAQLSLPIWVEIYVSDTAAVATLAVEHADVHHVAHEKQVARRRSLQGRPRQTPPLHNHARDDRRRARPVRNNVVRAPKRPAVRANHRPAEEFRQRSHGFNGSRVHGRAGMGSILRSQPGAT
jgi:hypothetical protein